MPTTTPFNNLITFSRGSNATVTGSNGLIQWAPSNLVSFSEQFDNAGWTKDNSIIYANQNIPDGTFGPELVTLLDGWTPSNATVAVVGGQLVVTSSGSGTVYITKNFANVGGAYYYSTSTVSGGSAIINTYRSGPFTNFMFSLPTNGTNSIQASTDTDATAAITLFWTASAAGETRTLSSISVREITPAAATAPDGTNTADTWVPTASGTTATVRLLGTASLPIGYIATASVYVKSAGKRWVYMTTPAASSSQHDCWFDLQTGTVGTQRPAVLSATITPVGNGWYRLTTTAATVAIFNYIFLSAPDADASNVVTANGGGLLVWGAQLELGSTATTYNSTTVKNLLGFSEAFDNAAWPKTNTSIVTGAAANPVNNLFNAQKLMENTAAATQHYTRQNPITVPSAAVVTLSVYAKAGERRYIGLLEGYSNKGRYFDLQTGTVGNILVGAPTTSSITPVGSGWYRCSITTTAPATTVDHEIYLSADGASISYTGDGNSGVYIYGAQLSDSASLDPYVPTPGAAPSSTAFYGPRFDFDPVTLAPRGILIEEQRTNLVTYSDQFNDASWAKNNVTVTANTTTSPDGTVNADTITSTSATTAGLVRSFASTAVAYTFSVYLKQGNTTFSEIEIIDQGTVANRVRLTYATGALTVVSGSPTGTATSVGNGWWRVTIAYTFPAIGAADTLVIYPSTTTGSIGEYCFAWAAQLEIGSFATSYIPTVASTVTRSADVATITGQNFAQWFGPTAGTFIAETSLATAVRPRSEGILGISNGSSAESTAVYRAGATSSLRGEMLDGGVAQASYTVAMGGQPDKSAFAYELNNSNFALNGAAQTTDTACTLPTVDRLLIGAIYSSGDFPTNGHIRNIRFIPARAADFQLQGLST